MIRLFSQRLDTISSLCYTKNRRSDRSATYDSDLGLYCLKTRYYDSETGRFISPDDISVTTATTLGLTDKNLYAYCDNNPVMRVDQGVEFWNYIIGGIVGGLVGGIVAANNFLKQSKFYLNAYRGVSSVVGSIVSMWYIVR